MRLKNFKKTVSGLLSVALLLSLGNTSTFGAPNASAAAKSSIRMNKASVSVTTGKKVTLKLVKKNIKKVKSMKWTTSKKSVATVSKKGIVTGKKAGKTTITCKVTYLAKNSKNAKKSTLKCKVTVKKKAVTATNPGATTAPVVSVSPTTAPVVSEAPVTTPEPVQTPFYVKSDDTTNIGPDREVAIVGGTSSTMTVKDNGVMRPELSSQYLIANEMGQGINLGNTMEATKALGEKDDFTEATDFETAWGAPITTQKYIDSIHSYGFNTLRIPVAWSSIVSKDGNYTISEKMLGRVEEIANYALNNGMYVIINDHYDYGWWGEFGSSDPTIVANAHKRYEAYWTQITNRFKNYSDHVIFESANEEFGDFINEGNLGFNTAVDGVQGTLTKDQCYDLTNELNQTFLNIVRASGGNNASRHLLLAGFNTDIDKTTDARYIVPTDTEANGTTKLSVSIHYYTPWEFCGDGMSTGKYTDSDKALTEELFTKLDRFTKAGYGVIVGEYAVQNQKKDGVIDWLTDVMQIAANHGCLPVLWDTPDSYFDRRTGLMNYKDVAELYNRVTGANGNTADIKNSTGKPSAKITPVDLSDTDTPVWTWEGIWAKNNGSNIGIDGEAVTAQDPAKFVQETSCTNSSMISFNPWGYQAFLELDWTTIKSPCLKITFEEETEEAIGNIELGTMPADKVSSKDIQGFPYEEWAGKAVIIPESMILSLKTNPALYLTFHNSPRITKIEVYDKAR